MESKPATTVPPWPLLQILPPGSCQASLSDKLRATWECEMNMASPPYVALFMVSLTTAERQGD